MIDSIEAHCQAKVPNNTTQQDQSDTLVAEGEGSSTNGVDSAAGMHSWGFLQKELLFYFFFFFSYYLYMLIDIVIPYVSMAMSMHKTIYICICVCVYMLQQCFLFVFRSEQNEHH